LIYVDEMPPHEGYVSISTEGDWSKISAKLQKKSDLTAYISQ